MWFIWNKSLINDIWERIQGARTLGSYMDGHTIYLLLKDNWEHLRPEIKLLGDRFYWIFTFKFLEKRGLHNSLTASLSSSITFGSAGFWVERREKLHGERGKKSTHSKNKEPLMNSTCIHVCPVVSACEPSPHLWKKSKCSLGNTVTLVMVEILTKYLKLHKIICGIIIQIYCCRA